MNASEIEELRSEAELLKYAVDFIDEQLQEAKNINSLVSDFKGSIKGEEKCKKMLLKRRVLQSQVHRFIQMQAKNKRRDPIFVSEKIETMDVKLGMLNKNLHQLIAEENNVDSLFPTERQQYDLVSKLRKGAIKEV